MKISKLYLQALLRRGPNIFVALAWSQVSSRGWSRDGVSVNFQKYDSFDETYIQNKSFTESNDYKHR